MRRRGFLVGALSVPIALALTGCGADYRTRAQKLADEVFPGKLKVIDVVNDVGGPVPVPTRAAVYRVVDDPDACVEISRLDADELRTAYPLARQAAVELRILAQALSSRGFGLQGFAHNVRDDTTSLSCYVEAAASDDTMAAVEKDLDEALAAWLQQRTTSTDPYVVGRTGQLRVGLVDPATTFPDLPADQPLARRLDFKKRNDALASGATASTAVYVDRAGRLDPVADRMQPNTNAVAARQGVETAKAAVDAWLAKNRPELASDGEDPLVRRLKPGSMTQLRLYFRALPAGSTGRRTYDLVAVTFDLERRAAGQLKFLARPAGGWPLPIEPDL